MLYLDSIGEPSEHVQARAAWIWVRKVSKKVAELTGIFEFRCTPHGPYFDHKSKTKRRVTVDVLRRTAKCVDWYSGEPCQANAEYVIGTGEVKTPRLCCHVWAALEAVGALQRRKKPERRAA